MDGEAVVVARGLGKRYHDGERAHVVLDDLELEVHRGALVVLLGRSGSGKSTLLNLLGAMDRPDDGELMVAGAPLHRLDEAGRTAFRRQHVGFVFQDFNLLPTLSAAENIALPLELNGVPRAAIRSRVAEVLGALGLAGLGDRYPERLSGGEQQRVAIGRALIHRPALVLADEPTGNLDLETGRSVVRLLDELTRAAGRTLIMATHSPEVAGQADRVLRLVDGRLREVVDGP